MVDIPTLIQLTRQEIIMETHCDANTVSFGVNTPVSNFQPPVVYFSLTPISTP